MTSGRRALMFAFHPYPPQSTHCRHSDRKSQALDIQPASVLRAGLHASFHQWMEGRVSLRRSTETMTIS
jgi:hypothetical protein